MPALKSSPDERQGGLCGHLPSPSPTITFVKSAEQYKYWPKNIFWLQLGNRPICSSRLAVRQRRIISCQFCRRLRRMSLQVSTGPSDCTKVQSTEIGLTSLYINGIASPCFSGGFQAGREGLNPDSLKAALETFKDYNTGGVFHRPPILQEPCAC